ncbi:tyrosine-protein phosphatase non-receptor type 18 [Melopsittacus undulatus]|uniref:tyrosine-protein phosphatase non-receptor type 18 n=1 Tax=Melopsittacus undulatus TaxID=13146 RepID=UPI001469CCC8|nr:tyrosine-protein phosphatase non-receptor type 18 [Melopsittacus undulatus]
MDVTYAVVNKARKGGVAAGRDSAPLGRGSASPLGSPVHRPSPASSSDVTYEVVTPPDDPSSPPHLGFNNRIRKPKGPREPPAEWAGPGPSPPH